MPTKMPLDELAEHLASLTERAKAALTRLEKDAVGVGRQHLAQLKDSAREKILEGLLTLVAKLNKG